MKRTALLVIALGGASVAASATQYLRTFKPVDEAATQPDFLAFRTRLQAAIARHDVSALLEMVDPGIKNSFGGNDGIEEFKEMWRPNDPDSEIWKELGTVLALGGSFAGPTNFTAPYTFSSWPHEIDSFESIAVIGADVRIRSRPEPNGPVVSTVSYAILQLDSDAVTGNEAWTAVKFGGMTAFISTRYVRSPIDYRARFSYSAGRWRMIFFLAGD